MSRDDDKKTRHPTNALGVPLLPPSDAEDAPTPQSMPNLWGDRRGPGLDVTVGFSTTNKWISRIIRWVTRGKVSHAWIAYDDYTLGLRMVMQAEAWAFEVRPWQRWIKENKWVAEFKLLGQSPHAALKKRAQDLGQKYDWMSGFWVGVAAWFKRWLKARFSFRPSRTPKRLMCSEAVVRFLKDAGCASTASLDEELTSPAELYDIVRCSDEFLAVRYYG